MSSEASMKNRISLSGMTLIEVLISMAIGMMLIGLAWSVFTKTKSAAQRTSTRVELHTSAAHIREIFQRDISNMSPSTALFVRSQPQVASGTDRLDTLEFCFMRTTAPLLTQSGEAVQTGSFLSDLHWVRWRFTRSWRQIDGVWTPILSGLNRSRSSPSRRWDASASVAGAPGTIWDNGNYAARPNGGNLSYINLPRPIRDASAGIDSLDYNTYNTPVASVVFTSSDMGDIGDRQDLDRNELLASNRVKDILFGWVDEGGQSHSVTSAAAADHRIDGLHMDVAGGAGYPHLTTLARQPRILRVTMTLAEGDVTQDFSFSIAAPGLAPQYRP